MRSHRRGRRRRPLAARWRRSARSRSLRRARSVRQRRRWWACAAPACVAEGACRWSCPGPRSAAACGGGARRASATPTGDRSRTCALPPRPTTCAVAGSACGVTCPGSTTTRRRKPPSTSNLSGARFGVVCESTRWLICGWCLVSSPLASKGLHDGAPPARGCHRAQGDIER